MNKFLLATSIVALSAGAAVADVSFSGEAAAGFTYLDTPDADVVFGYSTTLSASMSGTTDGGLDFGVDIDVIDFDGDEDGTGATAGGDFVLYVSGAFGTVSLGDVDSAVEAVSNGLGDLGWDGAGVDDIVEDYSAIDSAFVLYEATFGDLSVAASAAADESFAIGAGYDFGIYNATFAYQHTSTDVDQFTISGGASFGDVAVAALATYSETNDWAYGAEVSYAMDAWDFSVVAAHADVAPAANGYVDAYGATASYNLGGGMSVSGGLGSLNDTFYADLGIDMAF